MRNLWVSRTVWFTLVSVFAGASSVTAAEEPSPAIGVIDSGTQFEVQQDFEVSLEAHTEDGRTVLDGLVRLAEGGLTAEITALKPFCIFYARVFGASEAKRLKVKAGTSLEVATLDLGAPVNGKYLEIAFLRKEIKDPFFRLACLYPGRAGKPLSFAEFNSVFEKVLKVAPDNASGRR